MSKDWLPMPEKPYKDVPYNKHVLFLFRHGYQCSGIFRDGNAFPVGAFSVYGEWGIAYMSFSDDPIAWKPIDFSCPFKIGDKVTAIIDGKETQGIVSGCDEKSFSVQFDEKQKPIWFWNIGCIRYSSLPTTDRVIGLCQVTNKTNVVDYVFDANGNRTEIIQTTETKYILGCTVTVDAPVYKIG